MSVDLFSCRPRVVYLLVISKVVPKIWARTNSAIFSGLLRLNLPLATVVGGIGGLRKVRVEMDGAEARERET